MDKSRQRYQRRTRVHQGRKNIINVKKKPLRFGVSLGLTLTVWFYCFLVFWFFLTSLFSVENELSSLLNIGFKTTFPEIRAFTLSLLMIFAIFFIGLLLWRTYNKMRFQHVTRRKMAPPATVEEMGQLGLMNIEDIKVLQNASHIRYVRNPIKEIKGRGL